MVPPSLQIEQLLAEEGNTLEFLLNATRDAQAAKCFFAKVIGVSYMVTPRVITVNKPPFQGILSMY